MDLLSPLALVLLPVALVPWWLSRRRRHVARRLVSSLDPWRGIANHAPEGLVRPRPWEWTLLLQALFLAAVVAAVAHPISRAPAPDAAFVFDVSASMSVAADGRTRLDLARGRALEEARRLPSGARVLTVAAGDTPRVIDAPLADALERLETGAGGAYLDDAIGAARAAVPGAPVLVFSDRPAPDGADVRWIQVGTPAPNVALTALTAVVGTAPGTIDTVAEVSNFGPAPVDAAIEITTTGGAVHTEPVRVTAGATVAVSRSLSVAAGVLEARVRSDANQLAVDDVRTAVVATPRSVAVVVPADLDPYVTRALAAHPSVRLLGPDASEAGAIRVCSACADEAPGWGAVLELPPTALPRTPPAQAAVALPNHPLARDMDVSDVTASTVRAPVRPAAYVVLSAGGAPLVTALDVPGRRVVSLHTDLSSPAFAVSTAFPILIANALEWLADSGDTSAELSVGDPIVVTRRADGTTPIVITHPDGRSTSHAASGRTFSFTDTNGPGHYTVAVDGETRSFAVNVPAGESDVWSMASSITAPPASFPIVGASALSRETDWRSPLLVAALLLLAAEWWLVRRKAGRRGHVSRAVAAVALLAAVADLRVPVGRSALAVAFVVDRSDSVPPEERRAADARLAALATGRRGDDRAAVIAFGAAPVVEQAFTSAGDIRTGTAVVRSEATNIESAIGLARTLLPVGASGRIAVLSDGLETSGDGLRAAARAAAAGVPIDVVALASGVDTRVADVVGVHAPARVRAGEPFRVTGTVAGRPGSRVAGAIVTDDGRRFAREVVLSNTGIGTIEVTDTQATSGPHVYRAVLDEFVDASLAPGALVFVDGRPALLYVGGAPVRSLDGVAGGFAVSYVAPESIPAGRTALAAYDAVILDDVGADRIAASVAEALRDYVARDGGGLLVLGGPGSLSPGPTAALDGILPVDLRARAGQRGPTLAYVLLVDTSGSMADLASGVPKIELARQSALAVLDALPRGSLLGVIAFDRRPHVVVPLAAGHTRDAMAGALRGLDPAGATEVAPSLNLALEWLAASGGARRRVLLISDGRTSPADAARLQRAAAEGAVELSVVAIGPDADRPLLTGIARRSGGRAYFPEDLRRLPAIVRQDAAQAAGPPTVDEPFALRAPAPHPSLSGIALDSLPRHGGYIVGALRPGATTILSSHLDDPVLAAWRYGVGRAALFTGGLSTPWSAPLRRWAGFPRLWTQTLRWVARRTGDRALDATAVETDEGGRVAIAAWRNETTPVTLADARVVVRRPGGVVTTARARRSAPGAYDAPFASAEIGPHVVEVSGRDASTGEELRTLTGVYRSAILERAPRETDRAMLNRMAAMTGGRVLDGGAGPFDADRPLRFHAAAAWLALAALTLFLAGLL